MTAFLAKDCEFFKADAFNECVVKDVEFSGWVWWSTYGGKVPELQRWAMKILRLKGSSSSAERNWSVWGLVQSKLRNRLSLLKAEKLVFIYQNLRFLRMMLGDPAFMPLFSTRDPDATEPTCDSEDVDVEEVAAWFSGYVGCDTAQQVDDDAAEAATQAGMAMADEF